MGNFSIRSCIENCTAIGDIVNTCFISTESTGINHQAAGTVINCTASVNNCEVTQERTVADGDCPHVII